MDNDERILKKIELLREAKKLVAKAKELAFQADQNTSFIGDSIHDIIIDINDRITVLEKQNATNSNQSSIPCRYH